MYSRLPVWAPEPGPGPAVPGGSEGRRAPRDRRDRGRLRPGRRALHGRRVRRRRAAVLALVDRPRVPVRAPPTAAPTRYGGSLANRARLLLEIVGGGPGRDRAGAGARRPAVRRRADRGRHDHRRRRGGRAAGRGHRAGRLHQHLDRRRHRHPVHDRGEHAGAAGVRHVHPERDPGRRVAARGRGRPVQGPACRPTGRWRRARRPGRRGPRPDRRPRLRAPRRGPARPPGSAPACPATRSASGRMGLNRWLGCIENPRAGRESVSRCPRRGGPAGGGRRRRRAGWPAGGGDRGRERATR